MKSLVLSLIFIASAPEALADARACAGMKATFAPKEAEISAMTQKRDATAEMLEAKGEMWDDAEVLRLFSGDHAKAATLAQTDYETLERDLVRAEMGLHAALRQYNLDVTQYNGLCTTK